MQKTLTTKWLTALLWTLVLTLMPMNLMADENTPLKVTVTYQEGSFAGEKASNAFDGNPETKWCGGILTTNNTNAFVQVLLDRTSKLDYYYLYTGNDINYEDNDGKQQRNPKEWKLYAKGNSSDEWTLISHVTDAGLPTTVSTRSNNYKIDAEYQNIEYNFLKFEILQVEQGTIYEVGEICFVNCTNHSGELVAEVPATCTETGLLAYRICDNCGKRVDENGNELADDDMIIPIADHDYVDGVCTNCGSENPINLTFTVAESLQGFAGEEPSKAIDGVTTNKWCGNFNVDSKPYMVLRHEGKAKLDHYCLYTGNDIVNSGNNRNPNEWKLYAKVNEGDDWTEISHVTDAQLPTTKSTPSDDYAIAERFQNTYYKFFKFEILGVVKGTIFEVGELYLTGIPCHHQYAEESAFCSICGEIKEHEHNYVDGICTKCNIPCSHEYARGSSICSICDMPCSHEYDEGSVICLFCKVVREHDHNYADGICEYKGCDSYIQPEGEGTEQSPYLIANSGNILWLNNNFNDSHLMLVADVSIKEAITVSSENTLSMNLNGHALTAIETDIFNVNGGVLNLSDAESNAGKITKAYHGAMITNGGTFNMYGGSITECTSLSSAGAAVNVHDGTFNMFGGVITENVATQNNGNSYRGVVYVEPNNGYFNMCGGSIINNVGRTNGAGVYCVAEFDGGEGIESDGCLAEGTLVTMADGSKKAIESVAIGESVLTLNHDTGEMTAEPVFFIHKTEMGDAFTLHFSNGTDVTAVKYHSFFEKESNQYATLNPQNASSYIGRSFYSAEANEWVELTGVTPVEGTVGTYALLVAHTLNHFANGMLSAILPTFPVYNAFEYGDNLTIDQEKKDADIALYGTMDYEVVKDAVSREFFDAVNGQYAPVLFGKGMANMEDCLRLVASYLPQNNANQRTQRRADEVKTPHVTLSGKVIISGNKLEDNDLPSNLAVSEGMLSIGTLEAGSMIGIDLCRSAVYDKNDRRTLRVDGILAYDAEEGDVQFFTPDKSSSIIAYNEGNLELTHQDCYYEGESVFCSVCGAMKSHGHIYDEGVVTKEPSCSEAGEKQYSCTRCGEIKTDEISPLLHTLDDDLKCTVCGHVVGADCIIEYTATERLSNIEEGIAYDYEYGEEAVFDYTDKEPYPGFEDYENFGEELFGVPAIKHEYDEATGKGRIICNAPVTKLERFTYLRPERLTSFTLPSTVKVISSIAFYDCSNLTSITLLAEYSEELKYDLELVRCNNLQEIIVPYNSYHKYIEACDSDDCIWYEDENGEEHKGDITDYFKSLLPLDDTKAFETPENEVKADATLQRSFSNDGWYSLCLPFSVSVEDTPFSQVAEFSELDGDTYRFTTVDAIEAGKAYIVKVDAAVANPTFKNVFITTEAPVTDGDFIGVYCPTELVAGCKVIGSGTTVNPANAGTMKGFRAYFPASSNTNARYFSVDDSEINSVESIKVDASDGAIYNMQGIKVAVPQRGLYIMNGKKVYVR